MSVTGLKYAKAKISRLSAKLKTAVDALNRIAGPRAEGRDDPRFTELMQMRNRTDVGRAIDWAQAIANEALTALNESE